MSLLEKIKEIIFFKSKKNMEQYSDSPKIVNHRELLAPSVIERVISESKAEKEAKEAIQRGIDKELRMKSGQCSGK